MEIIKKTYTYPEESVKDIEKPELCNTGSGDSSDNPIILPPTPPGETSILVTYNCNGGTISGTQAFLTGLPGQKFSHSCTRKGYNFEKWNTKADGTGSSYELKNNVTDKWIKDNSPSITLYAKWKVKSFECEPGYYLKKQETSCTKCIANNYCPGGTYNYNETKDQGINKCSTNATGYDYSKSGSDKINDCYMNVSKDYYVKTEKDKTSTKCPSGQFKDAHTVYYGKTSSCVNKTITVTFDCNGGITSSGSTTATEVFESSKSNQKFKTACTKTGNKQNGWKKSKNGTKIDYETNSSVTENFVLQNEPKITLYADWENLSYKPATPIIDNPTNGNWTNNSFSLKVSTASPANMIGKWYYKYPNEKAQEYNGMEGKISIATTPFSAERNSKVDIIVCSIYALTPDDDSNCSYSSTMIRIDKTKPELIYDNTNHTGYTNVELRHRIASARDGLSGLESNFEAKVWSNCCQKDNTWTKLGGEELCSQECNHTVPEVWYAYRIKDIAGNASKIICVYCPSPECKNSEVNDNIYNQTNCTIHGRTFKP